MAQRLELHQVLKGILGTDNVYFQPPPDLTMNYPSIVYGLTTYWTKHSNNKLYLGKKRYKITYIDRSPVSTIPDEILGLPLTKFSSYFVVDNLNHYVFNTYF